MFKMKNIATLFFAFALAVTASAQGKFYTKTGLIDFFSSATLEDIQARNKTVTAILDSKTGAVQFSVLMKGFDFEKQTMQEHFNQNYLETDKYPKSEFKGSITNNASVKYGKDGSYPVVVKGDLTIHGVTKKVNIKGIVKIVNGKPQLNSVFNVLLSDYNVKIPAAVKDKLSNTIKITVNCALEPLPG